MNAEDNERLTPLHKITNVGYRSTRIELLEEEANREPRRGTPIRNAIQSERTDIVRLLLEYGATVDAEDNERLTPLHKAVTSGGESLVRLLLEQGVNVNAKKNERLTPLHKTVSVWYDKPTTKMILELEEHEYSQNPRKGTPLRNAVKLGQLGIVSLLLEYGANVNIEDSRKATPLHKAATWGSESLVKLLLEYGANVNTEDNERLTPLHKITSVGYDNTTKLVLELDEEIRQLDPWSEVPGGVPIRYCIKSGKKGTVRALLKWGANANAKDNAMLTPKDWAVKTGDMDILNILNGADPDSELDAGGVGIHEDSTEAGSRVEEL